MKILFVPALSAMLLALTSLSLTAQDLGAPGQSSGEKVFVKVTQNRELVGMPIELTEIKVTTSFGDVSIPLEKINGIKMSAGKDVDAVIAFKNGDTVTGKVVLDMIKLKTDWGQAHINTDQIETVTATENGRFYNDNTGGKSVWRFSNDPPIPASQLNNRANNAGGALPTVPPIGGGFNQQN